MSSPASIEQRATPQRAALTVGVLAFGTALVGVAIDLVLPSIPTLPATLGGTTATAQFVLAFYVAGMALGLVAFGWVADHFDRRLLFTGSLGAFALFTLACAAAPGIWTLIGLRFLEGAVAAGPVVVTPGMVRTLFNDARSVRVMGLLGSIQSLVPALAPIAGAWLASGYGWPATFMVTGVVAAASFLVVAAQPGLLPAGRAGSGPEKGTYSALIREPAYMRHAVSFALVLGGLVVFVFAAPVIIVKSMGGTIAGFIILQVIGVATFILTANLASTIARRIGTEQAVRIGTALALASGVCFLLYALAGGNSPAWLIPFWLPMNIGMGLRGPTGYVAAIAAAGANDARASALIGLFQTAIMALGTAAVAPFLDQGLIAAAIAVVVIIAPGLVLLFVLPAKPAPAA